MTDLAELRRLAEAATPGPWRVGPREGCMCLVEDARGYRFAQVDDDGNREWVAAANPATVLALLDRLDAAEARCAALDEAVMRINAEHLDDVQRLTRERDGGQK